MLKESQIDTSKVWYLGLNGDEDKPLNLVQPAWCRPFFLTDNRSYAEKYSDYGVYQVVLKGEVNQDVLDFDSDTDVAKLHWPKVLIQKIREGNNDLNSLAVDLYVLNAGHGDLLYIEDSHKWQNAASYFAEKETTRSSIQLALSEGSHWAEESDYGFLLEMWKDIFLAGFNGFIHTEFGSKVLALFSIKDIAKVNTKKI